MSRNIGISTHAVTPGDLRTSLITIRSLPIQAVELSALKVSDILAVTDLLAQGDFSSFSYVSFHAMANSSTLARSDVDGLVELLVDRQWPIIVHPDYLDQNEAWLEFDEQVCIENMDKRKKAGRTTAELELLFAKYPRTSFCLDIGHARQIDPTMTEAALMIRKFGNRLRQVHVSSINSSSGHDPISHGAYIAFQKIAHLIPTEVPIILETPVAPADIMEQISLASRSLCVCGRAGDPVDSQSKQRIPVYHTLDDCSNFAHCA